MSAARVVRYRTDAGVFTGIAKEGRTKVHVLIMGHPISLRKFPITEARHMVDLDYSIKRAARGFRRAGRSLGITKTARRFLKEVTR